MTANSSGPFCPECRKPATGNFCQTCGAKLGGRFCSQCGGKLGPAASFCSGCGAKAPGGGAGPGAHRAAAAATIGGQNLAWWIAGAAMFALIVVIGLSMVRPVGTGGPEAAAPAAGGATGAAAVDLSSMTPIEAADRLFNRVMTAVSQGDSAQAQAFVPMAIGAYERAQPLSHDGLFHLALLQRTAMDLEGSLATAEQILAEDPDHVLALSAAADAALELGRDDVAAEYYAHLLDVYDQQMTRGLEEYELHRNIMVAVRDTAEAFLAGR